MKITNNAVSKYIQYSLQYTAAMRMNRASGRICLKK